jgi:hypothetical protein
MGSVWSLQTIGRGRARGFPDPQKLSWLLDQAVDAYYRRDGAAGDGWLARLRLEFAIGFPPREDIEGVMVNVGNVDPQDPYWQYQMLEKAIEAREQGLPALAAGWLARLHQVFGCPVFDSHEEVVEAMEWAGFGELVLVDTGIGLPEDDE